MLLELAKLGGCELRFVILSVLLAGCSVGSDLGGYVPPEADDTGPVLLGSPDAGGHEVDLGGTDDTVAPPACPDAQTLCADVCVDTATDELHCGSCAPCPVVRGAAASCADSVCVYVCADGFLDMDEDLDTGGSSNGCECPGADGCPGDCVENACGGCGPLPATPGAGCGTCGAWECSGQVLACVDSGRNICGGCQPLTAQPGSACGGCGMWACSGDDVACVDDGHEQLGCPMLHVTLDSVESVRTPLRGAGGGEVSDNPQFVPGQMGQAFQLTGRDWARVPQMGLNGLQNIELSQGVVSFLYKPGSVDGAHHLFRVSLTRRYELRIEYDGGMHGKVYDTQRHVAVSQSWVGGRFTDTNWKWLVFSWETDPGSETRPWGVWYIDGVPRDAVGWHRSLTPSAESAFESMFVGAWHPFDSQAARGIIDDFRIYSTSFH